MALLQRFGEFIQGFDLKSTGKWFILSSMIGIVAGLGAIAFQLIGQVVMHFSLGHFAGYVPLEAAGEHGLFEADPSILFSPVAIVIVMALGGLASGAIVYTFAPEAEGHGTDAAIEAFHHKRGKIRNRIPFVKMIASAITIGTGGSGGREGPIAQIGAGFGSYLATKLNLSSRDRRIMLAAGMGAGVGAIFRAPLAGALFSAEILYRDADLESDVIVPSAIASIIGYSVYSSWLPPDKQFVPLFGDNLHYKLGSLLELGPLSVLAILLVLAAILYIKVFYGMHAAFKKLPIPRMFRPALGAALAGVVGLSLFMGMGHDRRALAVLSTGYGSLQRAVDGTETSPSPLAPESLSMIGQGIDVTEETPPEDVRAEAVKYTQPMGIQLLLAIAFFKIITTSLTIGSGGSGGVFGPSMVIGGCLGAAVGTYFHELWPELVTHPQVYAIVGMAGFFAGCAHAPISTIIMVSEMTGDYKLLLPTMWVSTLCFLLCRRWTLYEKQVPSRLESPAHRGDFIVDVLEGIKVKDVPRKERQLVFVPESMSLKDIVHLLAATHQHYFPVVDENQKMVGIFSADDVRSYLYDETIWELAVARDIMTTKIVSITPVDDLNTAMRRFTQLNLDELPVLDPEDKGKLLGMLRRKDTIGFYNKRMMEHKQLAAD